MCGSDARLLSCDSSTPVDHLWHLKDTQKSYEVYELDFVTVIYVCQKSVDFGQWSQLGGRYRWTAGVDRTEL